MVTLINPPSRLHYLRSMRSPANLGTLGDSILCPGPVKSQLDSLSAQLLQASNDLTATQNQVVAASQAGQDMSQAGQQLLSQRQDLETMISALTTGYRTFCGTVPPGLSGLSCGACSSRRGGQAMGLGILPAIPVTTAAALIAGLIAALAAWWIYEQTLKDSVNAKIASAQQSQQQNIAYAQQQLQQAIASGDTTAAAQWQAVIQANQTQPGGTQSLTDFLSANWMWIAAAVGGVFIAKEVL